MISQLKPKRMRETQYPLTDSSVLPEIIYQKCVRIHHASNATTGASAATLVTDRHKMFMAAALAAQAREVHSRDPQTSTADLQSTILHLVEWLRVSIQ